MSDDGSLSAIEVQLGELWVTVKAEDIETAKDTFDELWQDRLNETEQATEAFRALTKGYE